MALFVLLTRTARTRIVAAELLVLADRALHRRRARRFRARVRAARRLRRVRDHGTRKDDRTVHDLGFLFISTWKRWFEATDDPAKWDTVVHAGSMFIQGAVLFSATFLLSTVFSDVWRPALIVCPTSVLGNWQRELHRFAPELRTLIHHGPDRTSRAADLEADLADALELGPEHLSCYELEAKPGTRFTHAHGDELARQADAMVDGPLGKMISDVWHAGYWGPHIGFYGGVNYGFAPRSLLDASPDVLVDSPQELAEVFG